MSGAPLYALTGRYAELLELAEAGEDVGDALAQLDDAIEAKAVNICKLLATLDADAVASGVEERRLQLRRRQNENNADRLRAYLKDCMEQAGIKQVKSPQFSITLAAGTPRVVVTDADAVPDELVRIERTPDKRAILAEYKRDGVFPPGCEIVATTKLLVR